MPKVLPSDKVNMSKERCITRDIFISDNCAPKILVYLDKDETELEFKHAEFTLVNDKS